MLSHRRTKAKKFLTILQARRRRDILSGRLTRIERDIAKLEEKEELAQQDRHKVERLTEQVKESDTEFEQCHLEVLYFINEDDQDTVWQEEAVFDEHMNRVIELIERLEQFELQNKTPSTPSLA